jgi:hypothetical protein
MSVVCAAALAGFTGLHAATWGAFKDSPFEGFRRTSFVRSIVLAITAGVVLAAATPLESTEALIVLVGLLYAAERLATEWWKSFVREDEQTAYAIPMRFAVAGVPVDRRLPRYALGLAILLGLVLVCWAAGELLPTHTGPGWLLLLVGGLGGWLTAVGGAWKDAPVEGFSGWKFLRSPIVASAWACLLLPFTDNFVLLTVSAGGLSVASIETYKTFLTAGRPPGKFLGKPMLRAHRTERLTSQWLHAGLYAVFAWVLAASLLAPGTGTPLPVGQTAALLAILLLALNAAALVAFSQPAPVAGPVEPLASGTGHAGLDTIALPNTEAHQV